MLIYPYQKKKTLTFYFNGSFLMLWTQLGLGRDTNRTYLHHRWNVHVAQI